jgi:hypothetical protein
MGAFDNYDPLGKNKAATAGGTGDATGGDAATTTQQTQPTQPTGVGNTKLFPLATPGPQSWTDWATKTYTPSLTDYGAAFGDALGYNLAPRAVQGLNAAGLDTGMTPDQLRARITAAHQNLGPMDAPVTAAGYYLSPITRMVTGPLGTVAGAATGKIAEAASSYLPEATTLSKYLPEPVAKYLGGVPSSVAGNATQGATTNAITSYGQGQDPVKGAESGGLGSSLLGLLPGGQRVMPGDARTQAGQVLRDVTYSGRDVKSMADDARDSVAGGGASGVEFTAAPQVQNLVENLHIGMPTNAMDLVTLRSALDDIVRGDPKSVQAKVANAYTGGIDDFLNDTKPTTRSDGLKLTDPGAARTQVGAARNIMDATEPGTAPEPWWKQQGWVAPAAGVAGAAGGGLVHALAHQPGLTGAAGGATVAAPFVGKAASQAWNAANRLNAVQPQYNVMATGGTAAPVAHNALLNLMLSRMGAQ